MGCCSAFRKKPLGNIIFKTIHTEIDKCGNKELDDIFEEANKVLVKGEKVRQEIADKFKQMIVETGVCVLKRPSIERSVSSFMVQILVQIFKEIKNDYSKIKNFNFKSLFKFELQSPFFTLNTESVAELKKIFQINLESNKELMRAKDAILEFIKSLILLKDWLVGVQNDITILYNQGVNFVKVVKRKIEAEGEDGITYGQAVDYLSKGEKNLSNIANITQLIKTVNSFLFEIVNTITTLADKILSRKELTFLQLIANDAVNKNIFAAKEIVFYYSKEDKCKRIEDWEENICYKEIQDEEELRY
jgi:hypothetical protein